MVTSTICFLLLVNWWIATSARRRARKCLFRHLSKEQKKSWLELGSFIVVGNVTQRIYRIVAKNHPDRKWCDIIDTRSEWHHCIWFPAKKNSYRDCRLLPLEDDALAKFFLLSVNEIAFLQGSY
jgi:hypothetical protein